MVAFEQLWGIIGALKHMKRSEFFQGGGPHFDGPRGLLPPLVYGDDASYADVIEVIRTLENEHGVRFIEMGSHANLLTAWRDRDWAYWGNTEILLDALSAKNCNPHFRYAGDARVIHCKLGLKKFDLCQMDYTDAGTPIRITNFGGICSSLFATAISTLPHFYEIFNACRLLLGAGTDYKDIKLGTGDGQISSTAVGLLLLSHRKFLSSRIGPAPPFVMPGQGKPATV
jgi:hypothetical protein